MQLPAAVHDTEPTSPLGMVPAPAGGDDWSASKCPKTRSATAPGCRQRSRSSSRSRSSCPPKDRHRVEAVAPDRPSTGRQRRPDRGGPRSGSLAHQQRLILGKAVPVGTGVTQLSADAQETELRLTWGSPASLGAVASAAVHEPKDPLSNSPCE